ncbi:hypothetical protein PENFLA_c001G00627 [Penicillium flavigenum]|uniref:Uncharacterized protein n=1 Tax=Penicillium flavigenum TaxID=254877 RepID=A0A1V6U470_9EURO|nr:hypothetical protein PENFLA_c091G08701 [Penicillium flavigenum]OQE32673.1 hypothetical protein PENFLA_c001G00627 [Penicillium flavigenum]
MFLTIDNFLEPWHGPDADELYHTLATTMSSSSIDSRYDEVGQSELWQAFQSSNISNPRMRAFLDKQFTTRWQAWLPDLARVIYNERQLESLYYNTLITRVNIALQNAIPSEDPRVTVVVCPGSFDSFRDNGTETTILPDWVVVEGTYTPHDVSVPTLDELVSKGKIIAVGDTKLVRQQEEKIKYAEAVVNGTHSCHRAYLAQVQHYAHMLSTRFGFILTNKELVLAQFLREEEATPRLPRQRGLRSSMLPQQLLPELPPDFKSSDRPDGVECDEGPLHTPQLRHKRRHESDDSPTLPCSRPPTTDHSVRQQGDELPPSSPPSLLLSQVYNMPSGSPTPALEARAGLEGAARSSFEEHLSPTPHRTAQLPLRSPRQITSTEQDQLSSNVTYEPSLRDFDIGRALVRSFRIPNPGDEESMDRKEGDEHGGRIHPAKALFALLMHAYSVGSQGRRIDEGELGFEHD